MTYTYDWETCLLNTNEWERMLDRRKREGARMVSVSVSTTDAWLPDVHGYPVAYVFWETQVSK